VPCDAVVVALGHQPDAGVLSGEAGLRRGVLDNLLTDPVTLETGRKGVFAAGDVVTGGATVIEAIAAGQRAAASIDCVLRGVPPEARYKIPRHRRRVEALELGGKKQAGARACEPLRPAAERRAGFAEAVDGWSEETAVAEARRCLRCDLG
jgi:NADH-quinone oxidoreductase subunit F